MFGVRHCRFRTPVCLPRSTWTMPTCGAQPILLQSVSRRGLNVLISPFWGRRTPSPSPARLSRRSPPLRRLLQPLQLQVRPKPPLLFGGRRGAERSAEPGAPPGPGQERPRRPQEQPRGHGGCGQGRLRPAASGRKRSRPGRGNRDRALRPPPGTRARAGAGRLQRRAGGLAAELFQLRPSGWAPVSPQAAAAPRCDRGARSGSRGCNARRTCPTRRPLGGGVLKYFFEFHSHVQAKVRFCALKRSFIFDYRLYSSLYISQPSFAPSGFIQYTFGAKVMV